MSRWPGTTFQKQREQHNANRAYHLATQRNDHEFHARDSQGDTSLHIPCFPLEQSLARTTDSGRVVSNPEVSEFDRIHAPTMLARNLEPEDRTKRDAQVVVRAVVEVDVVA